MMSPPAMRIEQTPAPAGQPDTGMLGTAWGLYKSYKPSNKNVDQVFSTTRSFKENFLTQSYVFTL